MRTRLLEFLRSLEQAIDPGCGHHAITFARYGSDSTGWGERLALHVHFHNGSQTLFLEEGDLEKPAAQLTAEIKDLLRDKMN